ncbi:putative mitochondrial acyltransferase [Leptomonas pyrrhocoris]|uniref:Putative mitochondrial acyltransferase n=1 Tax=Leptomonas pyrrhocoris TaxID=157538 RepID=A0A0N0DVU6_LEPPY|nr:putative mitochondrial acyltransferase [Leptomonas pyrrhocoris]XP_015659071.1 putative mitochondrial acyltransferase [Leptomonas pyrrhocoris]KPA80631.1 putative mitochondrial acyltransferase [Leptomonas pyrrhocoris]KPA80632.1 putative mitochondrial acyltransferase [Leptomonas pyrrhocoris]|eukprot:XP_015659070.1 putative mitochondrial acyltransferase [Leptomonas pyrrhocoris]
MGLLCLAAVVAVYNGFLYLMRLRVLPVIVMRAWYTLHLVLCVIMSWFAGTVLMFAEKKLHLLSKSTSQSLERCVCAATFGSWLRYNSPHIHVRWMPGSLPWSSITKQHDLCLCHTSFFDTMLYLWYVPYSYIYRAKTFAKASLRKLPLFGTVMVGCGHFPVYFNSEEANAFSVDKAKQAAVAAEVEEWLGEGGSLSFFPEGALNRTPEVLKDFRLGSFNSIMSHKLPVYYCVTYGNHEVWNASLQGIPGYPADVYVYMGKYEYDPAKEDAVSLATGLRQEMQKHLNDMLALRERNGYKPWWKAGKAE